MDTRHLASLKEQLRPLVDRLDLTGTDIESFRQYLEVFRQRPVYLLPCPLGHEVFGLWAETDTADVIFYEIATTPYHQRHIVLHEGSHILQGHVGPALHDVAGRVAIHLDPRLIQSLLCRSAFSTQEEAEAEVLATLIEERMDGSTPPRLAKGSERSAEGIARFYREVR